MCDRSRPRREQDGWDEHAAFVDRLADEGGVVLGGPLGDPEYGQALLVVAAESEDEIRMRLADEPGRTPSSRSRRSSGGRSGSARSLATNQLLSYPAIPRSAQGAVMPGDAPHSACSSRQPAKLNSGDLPLLPNDFLSFR